MTIRHSFTAFVAATLFAGLSGTTFAGTAEAAATTATLSGQASYTCAMIGTEAGAKPGTLPVTIAMQVTVPSSVQPGQTLVPRGQLTFQFGEDLRQGLQNLGYTTVEAVSTTAAATTIVNGKRSYVRADRWQTSPTKIGNPMQVTAPLNFAQFQIPSNAKGEVQFGLPQNDATPRTVEVAPKTVAFSVLATATGGALGRRSVRMDCYLPKANPALLGKVPVRNKVSAAATPEASQASAKQGSVASAGSPGTVAGVPSTSAQAGADQQTAAAPLLTGQPVTDTGAQVLAPAASSPADPADPADPAGVYVPTGLLVLGGFGICVASLVYAGMANYRLRNIRRSIDS